MTLPPLPEPAHEQVEDYSGIAVNKVVVTPLFTADQTRAYAEQAVAAEREMCLREIKSLHWTPRVHGRWDGTDVAHAEGFNMAKTKALLVLGPNVEVTGLRREE